MLVLTDKTLAAAEVDFATAVALMEPPEGELIVHVRQELGPDDYVPPDDGGASLRHTHEGEPQAPASVPTIEPTNVSQHPQAEDRGYTLADAEEMARQQRMSLVYTGSVYVLTNVFGSKFYSTLAQVVGALRYGRW